MSHLVRDGHMCYPKIILSRLNCITHWQENIIVENVEWTGKKLLHKNVRWLLRFICRIVLFKIWLNRIFFLNIFISLFLLLVNKSLVKLIQTMCFQERWQIFSFSQPIESVSLVVLEDAYIYLYLYACISGYSFNFSWG